MKFNLRKKLRFGPLVVNLTRRGISSWGLKVGPWSWNARTRRHSVDTPGPGSFQSEGKHRR